jgi:hypothetical protein
MKTGLVKTSHVKTSWFFKTAGNATARVCVGGGQRLQRRRRRGRWRRRQEQREKKCWRRRGWRRREKKCRRRRRGRRKKKCWRQRRRRRREKKCWRRRRSSGPLQTCGGGFRPCCEAGSLPPAAAAAASAAAVVAMVAAEVWAWQNALTTQVPLLRCLAVAAVSAAANQKSSPARVSLARTAPLVAAAEAPAPVPTRACGHPLAC